MLFYLVCHLNTLLYTYFAKDPTKGVYAEIEGQDRPTVTLPCTLARPKTCFAQSKDLGTNLRSAQSIFGKTQERDPRCPFPRPFAFTRKLPMFLARVTIEAPRYESDSYPLPDFLGTKAFC